MFCEQDLIFYSQEMIVARSFKFLFQKTFPNIDFKIIRDKNNLLELIKSKKIKKSDYLIVDESYTDEALEFLDYINDLNIFFLVSTFSYKLKKYKKSYNMELKPCNEDSVVNHIKRFMGKGCEDKIL